MDDTVLHKGIMTGPTSSLTCMTQTGEMIWTKPQSVHSSPNMIQQLKVWPDRPTLFVATFTPEQDGLPCLIDADTGKERWRMKGSKQTPGRPIQVDSLDLDADGNPEVIYVAVQSADVSNPQGRQKDAATIYCINGDTGRVVWEREVLSGIASSSMPAMKGTSSWSPDQGAALSIVDHR